MSTLLGTSPLIIAEAIQQPLKNNEHLKASNNQFKQTVPKKANTPKELPYKWEIVWRNVLAFIYLHVGALYGLYIFFYLCQIKTALWGKFLLNLSFMNGNKIYFCLELKLSNDFIKFYL